MRTILLYALSFGLCVNFVFAQNKDTSMNISPYNHALNYSIMEREKQFDKQNLVVNNSFEHFAKEPKNGAAKVYNWTFIGKNIKLSDKSNDTLSINLAQNKCIRIDRNSVNEIDESADGVLSDFIQVIPGNYTLTYNVKLKKIKSNTNRISPKLNDAIQVRIEFYDKNKKRINGAIYYPYFENKLDNSNKGFTFSNFWTIQDFGWSKVIARTYNYPFSEGDLPENCRFVRLFFGLKGSGTMWIDDVDFRYSTWNFTRKEKVLKYINDTIPDYKMILPTPKYAFNDTVIHYYDGLTYNKMPLIVIPKNAELQTIKAAQLLKEEIDKRIILLSPNSILKSEITTDDRLIDSNRHRFVFSIGKNYLFQLHEKQIDITKIKDKEQGYIIKRIKEIPNLVVLTGNNPIGDYYAVATVVQLFSKDQFLYYHADIIDFPDFLHRSFSFNPSDSKELLENDSLMILAMGKNKMNRAYLGFMMKDKYHWKNLDSNVDYKSALVSTGKYCTSSGVVRLAATVHPYYHFDYEMQAEDLPDSLRYYWSHSNSENSKELNDVITTILDAGADDIMLCSDDLVPHEGDLRKNYSLYTPEDKKKFITLANAQAYLVNNVYKLIKEKNKNNVLEFCPPFYLNEFINITRGKAEHYFAELMPQIPTDVSIVWTGNTVRSLTYDMADIAYFKNQIGRYPMLFDNTLYARELEGVYGGYPQYYPEKSIMCSLFEPYDLLLPDSFYMYNDKASIFINGSAQTELYKIKYATVADYLWNNTDYNPSQSLWRALFKNFGKSNAIRLLNFDTDYFQLVSFVKMVDSYANFEIDFNKGDVAMKNMINSMNQIEQHIKPMNNRLFNELNLKANDILARYQHLKNNRSKVSNSKGLKQI